MLALVMGTNTARQRIAVKSGKTQVEQANIWPKSQRSLKATWTVMSDLNLVTVLREQDTQHLARVVVILHDEHPSVLNRGRSRWNLLTGVCIRRGHGRYARSE